MGMPSSTVLISAGNYEIGNHAVPNASPRHMRRQEANVWVEARPVTCRLFEEFVQQGGFWNTAFWDFLPSTVDSDGHLKARLASIDRRCCEILEKADSFVRTTQRCALRDAPLVGLTWFEAAAVARASGGRLPTELEWEIACEGKWRPRQETPSNPYSGAAWSLRGCCVLQGTLQEWTADLFDARYWRADFNRRTDLLTPAEEVGLVSVRGAHRNDVHQHICARRGAAPTIGYHYRGFRRVWDHEPTRAQLALTLR